MKRIFALILSVAVLLAVTPSTTADSDIRFTAVNNKLLSLSDTTMPYKPLSGIIYIPASVFDSKELGVSFVQNREKMTATLFSRDATLIFDLGLGISYDQNNTSLSGKAMHRNGLVFVPAAFVCEVFGLTYSYIDIETAGVVRIKNSNAISDNLFKNSITDSTQSRYEEYIKNKYPSSSPFNPFETPGQPDSSGSAVKRVYLTFDDGPNSETHKILDILDEYNMRATFFLQGVYMARGDDAIRRMVASGHSVGIHSYTHDASIFYSGREAMIGELERCNELLYEIANIKTRIVRVPYGSDPYFSKNTELRDALITAGYRYWDWNVDSKDWDAANADRLAADTIQYLKNINTTAVLLMHDKAITVKALPKILDYLKSENYVVSVISESDRPINYQRDYR